MDWELSVELDEHRSDVVRDRLIEHNMVASQAVRERFEPENLTARRVAAYAVAGDGTVLAGCVGQVEVVWHWLAIDLMWVDPTYRGTGLGRAVLSSVEDQARSLGCRWAKLNTWEFQAPGFYERCGYQVYAREVDYPPGHVNHLMRREL